MSELEDLFADEGEPTQPQPNSLGPQEQVCIPVMVERQRRKQVDKVVFQRLTSLEALTRKSLKFSRLTTIGVGTMVLFAALEYVGIIGHDPAPIWASAVIDGARYALGFN